MSDVSLIPGRVVTFGVFDLFHVGHLTLLRSAAALGRDLCVGVASDRVVNLDKGTDPVIPHGQRAEIVGAVREVSAVYVYDELEFIRTLYRFRPTVLAVGGDWGGANRHTEAVRWVRDRGGIVAQLSRTPGISTSEIVNRIRRI